MEIEIACRGKGSRRIRSPPLRTPTVCGLILFPEVLQGSVPQILFAAQVLHAANDAGLDPLRRRPLHALGRRPGMLLDPLPQPLADTLARGDESRTDIAAGRPIGHQGEGRLAGFTLDAKHFVFVYGVAFRL